MTGVQTCALPICIRNLLEFQKNPLTFLYKIHQEHGPTVSLRCGPYRMRSLTETAHIEHVLKSNAKNYIKRTPGYSGIRDYLGRGILTHEGGPAWRAQSKNIRPLFHPAHIRDLSPMMLKWVDRYCAELKDHPEKDNINLSKIFRRLTLSILCEAMFHYDNQADIAKVKIGRAHV